MTRDLTALFDPKSVAVLGASNDETKYGNWLSVQAVRMTDHRTIHLVNRRGKPVHGKPAVASLRDIGEPVDLATLDVSFISVTMILPAVARLLRPVSRMVILVKPQFEVGKGQVGKGGIVRRAELHREACMRVDEAVKSLGFESSIADSPILGTEGNKEFLLYGHH